MITIVDARMGRGKTSAAIRYMNENKHEKRFLYVTPYLSEVKRIRDECGFEEPETNEESSSKLAQLKVLLHRKKNIATTHAMFTDFMDDEAFELVEDGSYTLILDESVQAVEILPVSESDNKDIMNHCSVTDDGVVSWKETEYHGSFSGYKKLADSGELVRYCGLWFRLINPKRFTSFSDVYILTYLFNGQLLKSYFQRMNLLYVKVGVEEHNGNYKFSDCEDAPSSCDYRRLINIIGNKPHEDTKGYNMNKIGSDRNALSVSWYRSKTKGDDEIRKLRNSLRSIARISGGAKKMVWTTYKNRMEWLLGPNRRYYTSFLPLNTRATNEYRGAITVGYLVNRFIDPNIVKFFSSCGVCVSQDDFALSEMLQFIWRSAIRDGKPITVYMPSKRMRDLLNKWIDEQATGLTV